MKMGYDIAHTCAHVCKILHYVNNIKVCSKAKWKTIYKYSVLIKLSTRSLVIGSVTPTLQHNINSLWHVLIKRHAIMFTKIGIHWTHTLPYSWIPLGGVVGLFKRCLRSAQKCSMRFKFGDCACQGVEMVVMPTILARFCSCPWNHYHVERPTYLDLDCKFVLWTTINFLKYICTYSYSSYLQFCTMLLGPKSIMHPQIITDPSPCFKVQRVFHLQSDTMTYNLSQPFLSLSHHRKLRVSNHQWSNSHTFEQTLSMWAHVHNS